jgi:hypothetical protein
LVFIAVFNVFIAVVVCAVLLFVIAMICRGLYLMCIGGDYPCDPAVAVTVGADGGKTYQDIGPEVPTGRPFYIKYEVSVKPNRLLHGTVIPFTVYVSNSESMKVSLHEYSGNGDGYDTAEVTGGIRSRVAVSAKRTRTARIILRCEAAETETYRLTVTFDGDKKMNGLYGKVFYITARQF